MTTEALIKAVKNGYLAHAGTLAHNNTAIDMYEGNLLEYILADLNSYLSPQSFEMCKQRVSPINLLTKITDKLSSIYEPSPIRRVVGGGKSDDVLLEMYKDQFDIDATFQVFAAMLCLCKNAAIQPLVYKGKAQARVVLNDTFFVLALDRSAPNTVTHFVVVTHEVVEGKAKEIFRVYSDDAFFICDIDEKLRMDLMTGLENPNGENVYGRIPFGYVCKSKTRAMPKPDSDLLTMTKLIPVLTSDLNYASMFQTFSILYGIDVSDQGVVMAPNAFWSFRSDKTSDKKPEIGVLKPSVDIDAVLGLIQTQLSLWLNSRGIRPGTVGQLDKDSFASGISKMVDEMDTYEEREKLVKLLVRAERDFWNLVMHSAHPVWVREGQIETNVLFTPGASIETVFQKQAPMVNRGERVKDLDAEVKAKFTTRERAIKALNPEMSDADVKKLMQEIDEENASSAPAADDDAGQGGQGANPFEQQSKESENNVDEKKAESGDQES